MTAPVSDVLDQVRIYARRRGWPEIDEAATALQGSERSEMLLAVAAGTNGSAFAQWLEARLAPGQRIRLCGLSELAANPLIGIGAQRLIMLFSSGSGMLSMNGDINACNALMSDRERRDRAVVLDVSHRIVTNEDIEAARRLARSLFVAESNPPPTGQPLTGQRIFFWADANAASQLEGATDERELAEALIRADRAGPPPRESDALWLIDRVRDLMRSTHVAEANIVDPADALTSVELADRELRASAADVLNSLDTRLVDGLRDMAEQLTQSCVDQFATSPVSVVDSVPLSARQEAIRTYVLERFHSWIRWATDLQSAAEADWATAVDRWLNEILWPPVAAAAGQLGDAEWHGQTHVRERLTTNIAAFVPLEKTAAAGDLSDAAALPDPRTGDIPLAVRAAVGGALGGGAGYFLGPYSAVAGAALVAGGIYCYERMSAAQRQAAQCKNYATWLVSRTARRTIAELQKRIGESQVSLRDSCQNEMSRLRSILERGSRTQGTPPDVAAEDERLIAAWRRDLRGAVGASQSFSET